LAVHKGPLSHLSAHSQNGRLQEKVEKKEITPAHMSEGYFYVW